MAPSIGVNLRVTGHCNQGGRKYMEDVFSVAYQQGGSGIKIVLEMPGTPEKFLVTHLNIYNVPAIFN